MKNQEHGEKLIQEYYRVAPRIVANIDILPESKDIYKQLWEQDIRPCLRLIESNNYKDARERYEITIKRLILEYLNKN